MGRNQTSVIGTLVERQTRIIRLLHLARRDSESLHAALVARLADLPPGLLRSITWDQGTEMARHLTITSSLGAPIYFCDSHSPWQRGSNENANGLLRDYFPKGTDLSIHRPEHLRAVEAELNSRPRQILENRTPTELCRAASLTETADVATLTGTRPGTPGSEFTRNRHHLLPVTTQPLVDVLSRVTRAWVGRLLNNGGIPK